MFYISSNYDLNEFNFFLYCISNSVSTISGYFYGETVVVADFLTEDLGLSFTFFDAFLDEPTEIRGLLS
jgi:hypothetical protein